MEEIKRIKGRFQQKGKTEAEWYLDVYDEQGSPRENPFIPLKDEIIIFEKDDAGNNENRMKIGDGETNVMDLPFAGAKYVADNKLIRLDGAQFTTNIIHKGEVDNSFEIFDGEAKAEYSTAIGTDDKTPIAGILGSTVAGLVSVNKPVANSVGSVAFGGGAETKASGGQALGVLNTSGVKGYYWSNINTTNKTITLSLSQTSASWDGRTIDWEPLKTGTILGLGDYEGDTISIVNGNQFVACAKITAVSGNVITVDNLPFTDIDSSTSKPDDRTIFACYKKTEVIGVNSRWYPRAGSVEIGWAATAFGVENLVTGSAGFTGGFNNWQAGNFGATFGRDNIGGYCGVTSGKDNKNYGNHGAVMGRALTNNGPHNVLGGFENTIAFTTETENGNSNNLLTGQANVLAIGHRNAVSGYNNKLPRAFNCAVSGELNTVYGNNHIVSGKSNNIRPAKDANGNDINSNSCAVFGIEHDTNNQEYLLMAGKGLIASNATQCVIGKFNRIDNDSNDKHEDLNKSTAAPSSSELTNPALMIGNGSNANARATSCAIGLNGNIRTRGHITANGDIYTKASLKADGNITARNVSAADVGADGGIHAGGEISANGDISTDQNVSVAGNINAGGDVDANRVFGLMLVESDTMVKSLGDVQATNTVRSLDLIEGKRIKALLNKDGSGGTIWAAGIIESATEIKSMGTIYSNGNITSKGIIESSIEIKSMGTMYSNGNITSKGIIESSTQIKSMGTMYSHGNFTSKGIIEAPQIKALNYLYVGTTEGSPEGLRVDGNSIFNGKVTVKNRPVDNNDVATKGYVEEMLLNGVW